MKNLKLLSLKINETIIHFKGGLNYIVGKNASGKSTIFNCIRYALGLTKSVSREFSGSVDLQVQVGELEYQFTRMSGSSSVSISTPDGTYSFPGNSKDLNSFYYQKFLPNYLYESDRESVLEILDFCFISNYPPANRKHQWDVIRSICGINVDLLALIEKDIKGLTKEVLQNNNFRKVVNDFAQAITSNIVAINRDIEVVNAIEITKSDFFRKFDSEEELLIGASKQYEEMKRLSDDQLKKKLGDIENSFLKNNSLFGLKSNAFNNLEFFVKERVSGMSYREKALSWYSLFLAIAYGAGEREYNFPRILINDCFLFPSMDSRLSSEIYSTAAGLVGDLDGFQYIEFTHVDEVPCEHIVLNLNEGVRHAF